MDYTLIYSGATFIIYYVKHLPWNNNKSVKNKPYTHAIIFIV